MLPNENCCVIPDISTAEHNGIHILYNYSSSW